MTITTIMNNLIPQYCQSNHFLFDNYFFYSFISSEIVPGEAIKLNRLFYYYCHLRFLEDDKFCLLSYSYAVTNNFFQLFKTSYFFKFSFHSV